MEFHIHELPDGKATLMTGDGMYLFTFGSLESARQACEDWYRIHCTEARGITGTDGGGVSCSVCN